MAGINFQVSRKSEKLFLQALQELPVISARQVSPSDTLFEERVARKERLLGRKGVRSQIAGSPRRVPRRPDGRPSKACRLKGLAVLKQSVGPA